jgi:hypothetical protein
MADKFMPITIVRPLPIGRLYDDEELGGVRVETAFRNDGRIRSGFLAANPDVH